MAEILIAEDDKSINSLIKKNLELIGHSCTAVFDGQAVFDLMHQRSFDLILLDVMMPKADGFRVLREISDTPVILLTARAGVEDKVKGLRLGAYDYITKPFEMLELQARVESVLRRTSKSDECFSLGDVKVDLLARQVFLQEQLVDLTPQEYLLIETLIKSRNVALSRERLLEAAWGYDYGGDTRTVDVHIHKLRKKLNWEHNIKTVYKLGYRLEVK